MKNNLFKKSVFALVIVVGVLTIAVWRFSLKTSGQTTRMTLFSIKTVPKDTAGAAIDEKNSAASVSEAEITFNIKTVNQISSFETLNFRLFDGKIYEAARNKSEGLETRGETDFTWRGKLTEGRFSGDVILTFKDNFVSGLIYSPQAVYEIVPKGERQYLVELDQSKFPECAAEAVTSVEAKNAPKASKNAVAAIDSGDRIDVLVVYTAAVKNALGGDAQAQTLAQQAIDASNTAYLNSRIRQRVRLARAQETALVETGDFSTELSALRTNPDITALRDQYKADLVAMLTNSTGNCGIGYLMGSAAGNQASGFSVTARTCAVGNLSFAHELGHNMGSQHNPENGGGGTFAYSFGHYINGEFRTVMSYVDPCAAGCVRQPYFSNPGIVFNGNLTGVENTRDNSRSINNTADAIANYRYSGASITMNNFNEAEIIPRNISRTLSWSSDNVGGNVKIEFSRDEGANWQTLIASTINDGSETINISGAPTKRARLRIVSLNAPFVSDSSLKNISIR